MYGFPNIITLKNSPLKCKLNSIGSWYKLPTTPSGPLSNLKKIKTFLSATQPATYPVT